MAKTALNILESKHPRLGDIIKNLGLYSQPTLLPTDLVSKAVQITSSGVAGAIAVVDETRKLIGLVTRSSVLRAIDQGGIEGVNWPISRVMVTDVFVEKADADCMTVLARMIQHGFRNIPVVSDDGDFIACIDVLKIAHARLAELTEAKRKLMRLAINMAGKENHMDAAETVDAIRSFFNTSPWKTVIVKDGDRPIGYITADELLRAQYQTKDATTLV